MTKVEKEKCVNMRISPESKRTKRIRGREHKPRPTSSYSAKSAKIKGFMSRGGFTFENKLMKLETWGVARETGQNLGGEKFKL